MMNGGEFLKGTSPFYWWMKGGWPFGFLLRWDCALTEARSNELTARKWVAEATKGEDYAMVTDLRAHRT